MTSAEQHGETVKAMEVESCIIHSLADTSLFLTAEDQCVPSIPTGNLPCYNDKGMETSQQNLPVHSKLPVPATMDRLADVVHRPLSAAVVEVFSSGVQKGRMEGRFITPLKPTMPVAHPSLALMIAQHMRTLLHMAKIAMHLAVGRQACPQERLSQRQAMVASQMECLLRDNHHSSLSWTKLSTKRS